MTPSDTTWAIQLVDDGRGKAIRNCLYEEFDAYLEGFDWENNPRGVVSAREKRILTAELLQRVFTKFSACESQTQCTIRAATRTGGRIEVDSNFDKIQPVRFPDKFGESILPNHPLSKIVIPYFPHPGTPAATQARAPPITAKGGTVATTSASIAASGGTITSTGDSATAIVTVNGGTLIENGHSITASGGSITAVYETPTASIPITATGGTFVETIDTITMTGGSVTVPRSSFCSRPINAIFLPHY